MVKFSKFCSESFYRLNVAVSKCRKICPTGNRRNRALFTYLIEINQQNFGFLSNCRYCAHRIQNLPVSAPCIWPTMSQIHPNRFNFGGVIVECVKAVLLAHRIFAIFAFGRIIIEYHAEKQGAIRYLFLCTAVECNNV